MRSARAGVWLAAFVVAGSASAFGQVILPPNGSGRTIAADLAVAPFQQSVHSTGAFDFTLAVLKNTSLRFVACGTVCTTGPTTNVTVNIPVGKFGLTPGDFVTFVWTVRHRDTEGGTTSAVIAIIPVVPGCGVPPTPTTTRLPCPAILPKDVAARREETA